MSHLDKKDQTQDIWSYDLSHISHQVIAPHVLGLIFFVPSVTSSKSPVKNILVKIITVKRLLIGPVHAIKSLKPKKEREKRKFLGFAHC